MSKSYRHKERKDAYIRPKNTYATPSARCRCGSWLPKDAWHRLEGKHVVACEACRKDDNGHQ